MALFSPCFTAESFPFANKGVDFARRSLPELREPNSNQFNMEISSNRLCLPLKQMRVICIYIYMYVCIYIYMYVYMYIYIYMYVCIYVYIYVYIYIYIHHTRIYFFYSYLFIYVSNPANRLRHVVTRSRRTGPAQLSRGSSPIYHLGVDVKGWC